MTRFVIHRWAPDICLEGRRPRFAISGIEIDLLPSGTVSWHGGPMTIYEYVSSLRPFDPGWTLYLDLKVSAGEEVRRDACERVVHDVEAERVRLVSYHHEALMACRPYVPPEWRLIGILAGYLVKCVEYVVASGLDGVMLQPHFLSPGLLAQFYSRTSSWWREAQRHPQCCVKHYRLEWKRHSSIRHYSSERKT